MEDSDRREENHEVTEDTGEQGGDSDNESQPISRSSSDYKLEHAG